MTTTPARRRGRMVFPDIARGIGALAVVYGHIMVLWLPERHRVPPVYLDFLGLFGWHSTQLPADPGQVAVPLFFLISGFVVTPAALAEGPREFVVKRLLRIYPPLLFAVLLAATVILIGLHPLQISGYGSVTPTAVLTNATLINFVLVPQYAFVGVAWTLAIEIICYLTTLALLPLLRRIPWYAMCVELTFAAIAIVAARAWGADFFLFAVLVSFLPIFTVGRVLWAIHTGTLRLRWGIALGAVAWTLYVLADRLQFGRLNSAYELAFAYALLLFCVGLAVEPKLRPNRVFSQIAQRSYSIYLLHGVVLFPALDLLSGPLNLSVALPIALAITAAAVEACHRLIERPCRNLARRLTTKRKAPPEPPRLPSSPTVEPWLGSIERTPW
jgi:peptidoglycan/LPS O-acetylase OafA/YrhL